MKYTLNVGLVPSTKVHPSDRLTELDLMGRLGLWLMGRPGPVWFEVRRDFSEPTAVVVFEDHKHTVAGVISGVYRLAESLQQDCIAMQYTNTTRWNWSLEQVGLLVGPKPGPWQPFDPMKFLNPPPGVSL